MTEILKILFEKPKKIRLFILNFSKLLLTVLITNGITGKFELNFLKNIVRFKNDIHLGKILLYTTILVAVWFIIWYILEPFFILLIGLRKSRQREDREVQRLKERRNIREILKFFGGFTLENKNFAVPGENIHTIADIAEFVDEDNSIVSSNSTFTEALYILFVGWLYLLCNSSYLSLSFCNHLIMALAITILVILYRSISGFLISLKDHAGDVRILLDELEFRKMVMDIVIKDFRGHLNLEKESFDLNWGKRRYSTRDFYHYHEGLGNAYYLKKFRSANRPDLTDMIVIFNFNPNEELRSVLQEMNTVGIVVVNDDSELLDNLISELNRLKTLHENNELLI
jgi:hypothetical protein